MKTVQTTLSSSVATYALLFGCQIARAQETSLEQSKKVSLKEQESGEIVVTAERRTASISQVPLSITALSGDQLSQRGALNSQDLSEVVPGLVFARSNIYSLPAIRGVSSAGGGPGEAPNIATYFDGVYMPDAFGTLFDLSNIQRIEVLKGPQGTLYGRNATGGAISIFTKRPSFTPEGNAELTYGRFDYYHAAGYVAIPIVPDVVAVSASGVKYGDDGYIRNIFLDKTTGKSTGDLIRLRTLFKPSSTIDFELNGLYGHSASNVTLEAYALDANSRDRIAAPGSPLAPILNPSNIPLSRLIATEPYTTSTGRTPVAKMKMELLDAHMNWDLGFAKLSGLASFGLNSGKVVNPNDYAALLLQMTTFNIRTEYRNQELVLNGDISGRLTWLVGGSAFQSSARWRPLSVSARSLTTGISQLVFNVNSSQRVHSIAAFGEATYEALDQLFITGGIRYSKERRTTDYADNFGQKAKGAKSFHDVSSRANIRYQFDSSSNVYFSYTEGFKSGGFFVASVPGATIPVDPEKVTAYEVGVKAKLLPGLRVSGALYHYLYDDMQVNVGAIVNGVSLQTRSNAASAKIDGAELNVDWQVSRSFSLSGSFSFMRPKFTSFPAAAAFLPRTVNGVPTLDGNVLLPVDATGNDLINAPRRTVSLSANWQRDMLGGLVQVNGSVLFSSKYYFDVSNTFLQPAYTVANVSLGWRQREDKGLHVNIFVKNATNEVYASGYTINALTTALQAQKPRWAGLTIGYEF